MRDGVFDVLVQTVSEAEVAGLVVVVQHGSVVLGLKHDIAGVGHVVARVSRERLLGDVSNVSLGSGGLLGLGLASSDGAGLAAALDTLVAVLVVLLEVLEELALVLGDLAGAGKVDEEAGEALEGLLVEVVLVRLHVAELGEGLVAAVEDADIRLLAFVRLLVGANVAALSKELAADAAGEGLLASVAAHVRLEVSALGEGEAAALAGADVGLGTGVSAAVDVEVSLLDEALVAVGAVANPLLLGLLVGSSCRAHVVRRDRAAGIVHTGSRDGSRALSNGLLLGLRLDGLHKLINVSLKVDSVSRVNGLVVSDVLGVGAGVGAGRANGDSRAASCRSGRGKQVTLESHHGRLAVHGSVLVLSAEGRANGSGGRRALVRNVGERGLLVLRSGDGVHGTSSVRGADNVLRLHLTVHVRSGSSAACVVGHEVGRLHHGGEVVGDLRPAAPVGVCGSLSGESHCECFGCEVAVVVGELVLEAMPESREKEREKQ